VVTEVIKVPDLGDSGEVEVIELLVSVGQTVAENDSLLVLESEKAAMEIPAPMSGVVKSIAVNLGDQVQMGSEILTLEVESLLSIELESESGKPIEKAKEHEAEKVEESTNIPVEAKDKSETTSASSGVQETLTVPDLGDEGEVEVIEVHVSPGDRVNIDDTLITLESDKAAMDVPSTMAGEVKSLKVKVGDKVSMGTPILDLLADEPVVIPQKPTEQKDAVISDSGFRSEPADTTAELVSRQPVKAEPKPESAAVTGVDVYAGPAVRKLARELGVNLGQVPGSGAKGRIVKEDIHDFVKGRLNIPAGFSSTGMSQSPVADIDFSKFGEIEQIPRSKLQKLTAVNMHRNWSTIPHVAQFNEADITDLEAFRDAQKIDAERMGVKLTVLPFLFKACVKSLKEYPQFNVALHSSGEYLVQKKYFHIGFAVATEAGLVVPVIRNVDQKSIWELAEEVVELTNKAKQRKLTKEDMQGSCFTISSLGAIGGTGFIPIINAPEVAILGVGKTEVKPKFKSAEFVPRKMLPLTLSYDHRAVNGVDGGMFSSYLVKLLGDIRLLLL